MESWITVVDFLNEDKLNSNLIYKMNAFEAYMKQTYPDCKITVTADWSDGTGHVANSQHYLGNAVDFYVTGTNVTPFVTWLILERFRFTGVGWYPDYLHKGFHADVRPMETVARWQGSGTPDAVRYLPFDENAVELMLKASGVTKFDTSDSA